MYSQTLNSIEFVTSCGYNTLVQLQTIDNSVSPSHGRSCVLSCLYYNKMTTTTTTTTYS